MKLFISWSGERSRLLAEALHQWLPYLINAIEPWISSSDIDPGARWGMEIASELEKTRYGIICITADNLNAPWILFEAGALSKYVEKSRVVPLVLDIKPSDIKGPLSQFQAIQANEDDILKLIKGINLTVQATNEKGLPPQIVDETFKMWWPNLKSTIEKIPKSLAVAKKNERPEREIIEELLILVRRMNAKLDRPIESRTTKVLEDFPPPPDNFPDDWDTQWQPTFYEPTIIKDDRPGKIDKE